MLNHKMTCLNHGLKSLEAKLVTFYFDNEIVPKVKKKGGVKKREKNFWYALSKMTCLLMIPLFLLLAIILYLIMPYIVLNTTTCKTYFM